MLKTVGNPSTRYGDQTIIGGNLVIGTAGKGIDFSADAHAAGMTSELLDDYEKGTWTPIVSDGTTNVSMPANAGWYVKVGDIVTVGWNAYALDISSLNASAQLRISGVPFTAGSQDTWCTANFPYDNSGKNYCKRIPLFDNRIFFWVTQASSIEFIDCTRTTLGGTSVSFFDAMTYYTS